MKIISITPLKNLLELLDENTGLIYYFKPRVPASSFTVGHYYNPENGTLY